MRWSRFKLATAVQYPIWLSGSEDNPYDYNWQRPVVRPRSNVSEQVLQESAKRYDLPLVVFQVKETDEYGTGLLQQKKGTLMNIWFWKKGKWVDLDDLGGLSETITLVPLAKILGQKNVHFRLDKGKFIAVLQASGT
jgi:hypothetical protein